MDTRTADRIRRHAGRPPDTEPDPRGSFPERLAAVTGARLTSEELDALDLYLAAGNHLAVRYILVMGIDRMRRSDA